MEIEITCFSPEANRIFPSKELVMLSEGYRFTEGPVWDIKERCLYFTDFFNFLTFKWIGSETTWIGKTEVYRSDSNRAVGLSMDADGRIVAAESINHAIAYADKDKSIKIVDAFEGKALNGTNDVVLSKKGDIFFTDPFSKSMNRPRELDFSGVYTTTPNGRIRLLYSEMQRPNGIAFSPDESILYVNDTDLQHIIAFQMQDDGSASKIGVFAVLDQSYGPGAPDGMKVDIEGNVYVTGPGGVWVLDHGGTPLGILHTPSYVGNFCFGGSDNKNIFLCASQSVYTIKGGIPGIVPYRKG